MTDDTTPQQAKQDLLGYLQTAREALVWKLEGASEYDIRRPMTPTGTNLLGLVKHTASVESVYLGETFGRPFPDELPWFADDAAPNDDLWATAEETRESIVDLYQRVWAHSDETVDALALDTVGRVPWWPPDRAEVTLHRILVHIVTETHRHAGHADIVRESIDGAAGLRRERSNLWENADGWPPYVERLEQTAQRFR